MFRQDNTGTTWTKRVHALKPLWSGGPAHKNTTISIHLPIKEMADPDTRFGVVISGRIMGDYSKNVVYFDFTDESFCLQIMTSNNEEIRSWIEPKCAAMLKSVENGADLKEVARIRPIEINWAVVRPFINKGRHLMELLM